MEITITTKCCSKCKQVYPATLEYFQSSKGRKDGLHSWCKKCKQADQRKRGKQYYISHRNECIQRAKNYALLYPEKQYQRHHKWYLAHKELSNKRSRENSKKLRLEALKHYGNKCQCCEENRIEFLAIDHIYGGGKKHRQAINNSLYRWLRDNNYPDGFRVLCHNCNQSLGHYGYCPHQIT